MPIQLQLISVRAGVVSIQLRKCRPGLRRLSQKVFNYIADEKWLPFNLLKSLLEL